MEGVEALMRHVYVFPLLGLVLGSMAGAVAFIAGKAIPPSLVAIVVIMTIYKLCGINNIDGLADFGDGVVAHGPVDKKVLAMKDVNLGTGGVVFIAVILITLYSIISSIPSWLLPLALIAAEVSAKQSMIAFGAFSESLQKGFGQMMIERTGRREFIIGLAISAALCAAVLGPLGLAILVASQAAALYMVMVSRRNFGGATGDGIGATNEVCRAVALGTSLIIWHLVPWKLL
jgi:adenosylcobinamide-GDP ribazoletransferase